MTVRGWQVRQLGVAMDNINIIIKTKWQMFTEIKSSDDLCLYIYLFTVKQITIYTQCCNNLYTVKGEKVYLVQEKCM